MSHRLARRTVTAGMACAVVAGALLAPVAASAATKSSQYPDGAKEIKKWDRMLFYGIPPTVPPTAAELKAEAPAMNSVGIINVFWFKGTLPALPAIPPFLPEPQPAIPGVDVPGDFAAAGIPGYVWYNTLAGGDQPDSTSLLGLINSPGWNEVAGTDPPPKWIATDHTGDYGQWAEARGEAPIMVAHRGGGAPGEQDDEYPENSMAAFKRAVGDGAGILETDVQWTKPEPGQKIGVPVLMHDQTINRTVVCKPSVPSCTLPPDTPLTSLTKEQLDQYQLRNGQDIPTLERFLDYANKKRVGVLPEIKFFNDEPVAEVQPQLKNYTSMVLARTNLDGVIIGSFDGDILKWFKDQTKLTKQTADCATLPKRLRAGTTVTIAGPDCRTNAGKKVKVTVKSKPAVAQKTKNARGRVQLEVLAKGKVTVKLSANDARGYTTYKEREVYKVKGSANGLG